MSKRTQDIDADDNVGNVVEIIEPTEGGRAAVLYESGAIVYEVDSSLHRLIDSGIIVATEGAISWREGHLEHIARLYVSDPVQTWRDYADDLTVALSADAGTWAAVVEAARGDAE